MNKNIGETKERQKRFKTWAGVAFLAGAGAVVGFTVAIAEHDGPSLLARQLPRELSILLAVVTFIILTFGSWFYWRNTDEVEKNSNMVASATSAGLLVLVYPSWFLLWKGGVVSEPSHLLMYLLVCVTGALVFLTRQYAR